VTAVVASGEEAIQAAATDQPDLALMDIRLEGELDGIEAAKQIQARFNVPVIYLTAYADDTTLQRAKITEPFGYLIKPYQERDLQVAIEMALYKSRMDKKLKAYTAELETRNRELDTFSYAVANNLYSLVTTVIEETDFLQDQLRLTDELYKCVSTIARSGRKMRHVIDELLLLAKVRQTEVVLKPLYMGRIVAEAQQRLIQMIEAYQAEIKLPDHWPKVLGHGPWVEEVWVNFLSNGIQYGGRPPRLQIGTTIQSNNHVRFWMRDNGSGFAPDELGRLFSPHNQPSRVQGNEYGLRLSIVQHIVTKMGGQVGAKSNDLQHQGTIFSFTLPSPPKI
jgi:signal transduction histidine kinase